MTLDEVRAEIDQIRSEYAQEGNDAIADAIATWANENSIPTSDLTRVMSDVNRDLNAAENRRVVNSGLTDVSAGSGVVSLTPIRSGEGVRYSLPDEYTTEDISVTGRPLMSAEELSLNLPYNPYDVFQRSAYSTDAPQSVTFYDRVLNRPVPIVTKGVLPDGEPTTGITMGRADLLPSGEMDLQGVFPSTGANIMGSGIGGTTVGLSAAQAEAAGLPPGNATGNILATTGDRFITPSGNVTGANVLGTTGTTGTSFVPPVGTGTLGNRGTFGTPVDPEPVAGAPRTRRTTADLQSLYLTSPSTEIAGQRISDYAQSVGGLSANQIASAINPVIAQGGTGLLQQGTTITAPQIEEAVSAGGSFYGPPAKIATIVFTGHGKGNR